MYVDWGKLAMCGPVICICAHEHPTVWECMDTDVYHLHWRACSAALYNLPATSLILHRVVDNGVSCVIPVLCENVLGLFAGCLYTCNLLRAIILCQRHTHTGTCMKTAILLGNAL